jgi:predicted permease
LIVVVTLALAVGASTAVGSLLNAIVLRRLAVPSPEQLVALSIGEPGANVDGYFYADTFQAFRATEGLFAQLSMYAGGGLAHVETRSGVFENAVTEDVSPSYFDMVGARAAAGRFFNDSDDAVVVISEAYRRRIFGNAIGIGEAIKVDSVPATVIGIAAEGFDGLQFDGTVDIIVPFALMRSAAGGPSPPIRSRQLVGRLARGVSLNAARAELLARWPSVQSATLPSTLSKAEREALLRQRVNAVPLAGGFSGLRSQYGTTLWVLLALAGMLLGVACANLAGLTLARSLTRRHQVAIRLALGGSARRVFWQLLVDGLLLSAVAFAGALPLAWMIIRAVTASLLFGRTSSKFLTLTPDAGVIAATALLTACIGLAVGGVSASQSVTVHVDESLRRGRGTTGSLGRLGRGLLIAQVAMSMTLLAGAGLFTATLARLRANDTSLQSQRIVFTRAYRDPGDRQTLPLDYYRTLVTELARMPGADAAALSVYYPTYYEVTGPLPTPDYQYTQADGVTPLDATVLTDFVSPGFFDLFTLPRLEGRDFSWDDGPGKPAVALSLGVACSRAVPRRRRHRPTHSSRWARASRRRSGRRCRRRRVPQAGRPAAARRVPADSAGNGEVAVSDGVCPGERRRRDRARRIHASREVAGASVAARFHHVIRMGGPCVGAGAFHRGVGHLRVGAHHPAGLHGRVRAARILGDGARSRNRCAHGSWRRAQDGRLDDRAGRPGDCRARRADRRAVRLGRRAAGPGAALRHRPR